MSTVSARCFVVMHMYKSSQRQDTQVAGSVLAGAIVLCCSLSLSLTGSCSIPAFSAPLAVSCFVSSSGLYLRGTGHPVMLWCFWGCLVLTNISFGWLTWWCPCKALEGAIRLVLLVGVCSPAHLILIFSWLLFKTYSKCTIWRAVLVSLLGLCTNRINYGAIDRPHSGIFFFLEHLACCEKSSLAPRTRSLKRKGQCREKAFLHLLSLQRL